MAGASDAITRVDGTPARVLVVDDEQTLAELLAMASAAEGWETRTAHSGTRALDLVREFRPDAIIMDVMMPGLDGVRTVRRLREAGDDVPVLLLTAKDGVEDRIEGLSMGADDYVTKPFSLEEVVLRVRGMLKRHLRHLAEDESVLVLGDLCLDEETYEVERAGERIELTATEFALLRYLMTNPRKVLSKTQILEHVWNYDFGGRSSVVELYISYLRKKVDSLGPPMIHTVRGVGYTIRAADG